jgi:hypothetical protein
MIALNLHILFRSNTDKKKYTFTDGWLCVTSCMCEIAVSVRFQITFEVKIHQQNLISSRKLHWLISYSADSEQSLPTGLHYRSSALKKSMGVNTSPTFFKNKVSALVGVKLSSLVYFVNSSEN